MMTSYTLADDSVFISQTAQIWGQVEFASCSSAWFHTIFRSIEGQILIGKNSHISDQTRISNSQNSSMHIGEKVYIGTQCSLSDCEIGDQCYIGDRTMIHPGAIIPPGSFIAPNSVIVSQTIFPKDAFIQGAPASCGSYVSSEMRSVYQKSLSRMIREVSLFRRKQATAEQGYFLLQFSAPGNEKDRILTALFQIGAGKIPGYSQYCQIQPYKLESEQPIAGQEFWVSVACAAEKLQDAIHTLCMVHKSQPIYQIQPLYISFPTADTLGPRADQGHTAVRRSDSPPNTTGPTINFNVTNLTATPNNAVNTAETGITPEPIVAQYPETGKESPDAEQTVARQAPEQMATIPSEPKFAVDPRKKSHPALRQVEFKTELRPNFSKERDVLALYPEFFTAGGDPHSTEELPNDAMLATMLKNELGILS